MPLHWLSNRILLVALPLANEMKFNHLELTQIIQIFDVFNANVEFHSEIGMAHGCYDTESELLPEDFNSMESLRIIDEIHEIRRFF